MAIYDRFVGANQIRMNYSSINACLLGEQADLVTATQEMHIWCLAPDGDTTAISTSGQTSWVTSPTYNVTIHGVVPSADPNPNAYLLDYATATQFTNVEIEDLVIEDMVFDFGYTGSSTAYAFYQNTASLGADLTFRRCVFLQDGNPSVTSPAVHLNDTSSGTTQFYSCLFFGDWTQPTSCTGSNVHDILFYGCTVDGLDYGIDTDTADYTLKMTRLTSCGTAVKTGSNNLNANSDYNLTDASSGPTNWGSNSITSATVNYEDDTNATYWSRDYHLVSGDSGLGQGVAVTEIPDDLDGGGRSRYDIGCVEYRPTAVAVTGTSSENGPLGSGGNYTFSHTTTSDTDCLVVITFLGYHGTDDKPTAVTFNSDPMTEIGEYATVTGGGGGSGGYTWGTYAWGLITPDVGTYTVSVTMPSCGERYAVAVNLKNVDPDRPFSVYSGKWQNTGNLYEYGSVGEYAYTAGGSANSLTLSCSSLQPNNTTEYMSCSTGTLIHDDYATGNFSFAVGYNTGQSLVGWTNSASSNRDWGLYVIHVAPATGVAGQDLVRVIGETEQISEVIARFKEIFKLRAETEQVGEEEQRIRDLIRRWNESEALADAQVRSRLLHRVTDEEVALYGSSNFLANRNGDFETADLTYWEESYTPSPNDWSVVAGTRTGGSGSYVLQCAPDSTDVPVIYHDLWAPLESVERGFEFGGWAKWVSGTKPNSYLSAVPYTSDLSHTVEPTSVNIFTGTETTLAQDLNVNDTYAVLTSTDNWANSTNVLAIQFDIENDQSDVPNFTFLYLARTGTVVDTVTKRAYLQSPSTIYRAAGTKVRQSRSGGTYHYAANTLGTSQTFQTQGNWEEFRLTVRGSMLPYEVSYPPDNCYDYCVRTGTAYLRFRIFLLNHDATTVVQYDDLWLNPLPEPTALRTMVRGWSDDEETGEGEVRARTMARLAGETEQVSETSVRARALARVRTFVEAVAETAVPVRYRRRVADEVLQITETLDRILGKSQVLAETVQIVESITKLKASFKSISETVQISEALVRARDLVRLLAETVQSSEVTQRLRTMLRFRSDQETVAETAQHVRGLFAYLSETVETTEALVRSLAFSRIVTEQVALAEQVRDKLRASISRMATKIVQVIGLNP